MPELPEVHTTVEGLNEVLGGRGGRASAGKKIVDVWSAYRSTFHAGKDNIKNADYFKKFRREIVGASFSHATRRGKNVLIHLSNGCTILIHMKMTGHLLYGRYEFSGKAGDGKSASKNKSDAETWRARDDGPLQDPYNQFIRLVFTFSDGTHLAFSDMRKFAKVFVFPTSDMATVADLRDLGPEPLERSFSLADFRARLALAPRGKIKQVLMDQSIVAGIGNIYSDEILWRAGVHPLSLAGKIPPAAVQKMFAAMKLILKRGIDFGGDSDSDYRNVHGVRGEFQHKHSVYRRTGAPCPRPGCDGTIKRLKIGGRSAHFCPTHQKLFGGHSDAAAAVKP